MSAEMAIDSFCHRDQWPLRADQAPVGTDPQTPDCPIVTSDDVESAKPAPDLFAVAAQRLDKEPGDCFIVGDRVWDVLAGRRMKAAVVALRTGAFDSHELQESGACRVDADPRELGESLEQRGLPPDSKESRNTK